MIVYGHRGARGEAPENTIAGCRHALARGVQHIEIDLRLSRDGALVVLHDETLTRTVGTGGRMDEPKAAELKVSELTAAELARLDARADGPPWPDSQDTGIPTLNALLQALPQIQHWQLELKAGTPDDNAQLAASTAAWLREQPRRRQRFVVTSLSPDILQAVRQALPDQPLGYVSTDVSTGVCTDRDPRRVLAHCACRYLIARWDTLQGEWVRELQQQGIQLSAWTVNDASAIEALYRLKVNSVISDYPSMAVPLVAALERTRRGLPHQSQRRTSLQ